jgi:uncharacterized membrane protein
MVWLSIGIFFWFFGHGFKALFPTLRQRMADKMGEEQSKGPFALSILVSFIFIIYGWRHSDPSWMVYSPILIMNTFAGLLTAFGLYLFIASTAPVRMRQWIRHPQLTGLALWAFAHLLSNGEARSLVLFGGLLVWSITMMFCINRRDGAYEKPEKGTVNEEIKPIVITVVVFAVLKLTHGFYTASPLINW